MISRRSFLSAAVAAVAAPQISTGATKPLFQFGMAADAQYADIDASRTRFYRDSIAKLGAAVEHFNSQPLAFCVHLGDLIDRNWSSFTEIQAPLKKSRHTFHHVLGNHDFEVLNAEKPRVPAQMGLDRRYYSFDQGGFRLIFLDTTEVSTYAHPAETPEHAAAAEELERLLALKIPQAKAWNSGLSPAQLQWLDEQCAAAAAGSMKAIVFAHHPVAPEGVHDLWNSAEVLKILERHRNFVAWVNGHNHAGAYAEVSGAHFLTVHGMVETADSNAFATVQVLPDRLLISGEGREPSRELVFRS